MKRVILCLLLSAFLLSGLLTACNKTTTVAPSASIKIEHIGKWEYSNTPGWNTLPGFRNHDDEYLMDVVTTDTAYINGKDYLFLNFPGNDASRVFIYDMSNPLAPEMVSVMTPAKQGDEDYSLSTTAIDGNIYYTGLFVDKGLWMADISDPANPKDLGITPIGMTREMAVSGNYVYGMSQMNYDLLVGYIGDVQGAREVARIETKSRDCQLAVNGNLLLVGLDRTLTIYDITDPSSPQKLSTCELVLTGELSTDLPYDKGYDWSKWADIWDIKASGNYAYVAFGQGQVRVIDISDPANPEEIATAEVGGFAIALTLKDNRLYITKTDWESRMIQLSVVDITQPKKSAVLGSAMTESSFAFGGASFAYIVISPQIIGDYVYILGLKEMDIFKISGK